MLWYMIEGFNGYEINKDGVVKSMKRMYACPGHILKKDDDGYYTLTNNRNKRIKIKPEKLLDIVFNQGHELRPREQEYIYMGGRNKRFYFDEGIYPTENSDTVKIDFSQFVVKEE